MKKFICLVVLILLTSGCAVKEEYSLGINKDKSVDVNIVLGFDNELLDYMLSEDSENPQTFTDEERLSLLEKAVDEMNNENNEENVVGSGYTAYLYNEDEFKGFRLVGHVDNIDSLVAAEVNTAWSDLTEANLNELKLFTQNDEIYNLRLKLNEDDSDSEISTDMGDITGGTLDLKLVVTLPNEAESHNATSVSEETHTYTWDLTTFDENNIVLSFKINTIPWDYILIGGGIVIALVFLLMASSFMKKKGKINVKHMPKKVAGTSNVVDVPDNNVDNLEVINNQNINNNVENLNVTNNQTNNANVESLETLNIDAKLVDSLNTPVGNTEDVESLAMVETFKETKSPVDKENPNPPQFSFDNPNNNAAADYTHGNNSNNENNNSQ